MKTLTTPCDCQRHFYMLSFVSIKILTNAVLVPITVTFMLHAEILPILSAALAMIITKIIHSQKMELPANVRYQNCNVITIHFAYYKYNSIYVYLCI